MKDQVNIRSYDINNHAEEIVDIQRRTQEPDHNLVESSEFDNLLFWFKGNKSVDGNEVQQPITIEQQNAN